MSNLLTPRERKVIALIARGKTAEKVALELKISAQTVEADVKSAADKLGAANKRHEQANPPVVNRKSPRKPNSTP